MSMERDDWIGLAAGTIVLAALLYFVTCATAARAEPTTIDWISNSTTERQSGAHVCRVDQPASCWDVAIVEPCEPSSTCHGALDIPIGLYAVVMRATYPSIAGGWTEASNPVWPWDRWCLTHDDCRGDFNEDARVDLQDANRFIAVFGAVRAQP